MTPVVDAESGLADDGTEHMHLDLTILSGEQKGNVVSLTAGLPGTEIDLGNAGHAHRHRRCRPVCTTTEPRPLLRPMRIGAARCEVLVGGAVAGPQRRQRADAAASEPGRATWR
jgi:hypothetical protein